MRVWRVFILITLGIFLPIIFITFYIGIDMGLKYVEREQHSVVRKAYEDGTIVPIECKGFYFNDKLYIYIPSEDEFHVVNTLVYDNQTWCTNIRDNTCWDTNIKDGIP